ncbi:MAG: hypothetical protein RL328_211 [Acidobacteriota bacterium]
MRWLWMLATLGGSAFGQLTLYVVDGTTETALGNNSVFQLRAMEAGDSQSVRLRVRNLGSADAQITQFAADGAGFSLNRPLPPIALAPGAFVNATLTFTAGAAANYSANLRMNSTTVLMLATVTAGPTLTIGAGCKGTSADTIDFGTVIRGQTGTCSATLANGTGQPMLITTVATTGAGFSVTPNTAPMALAPGQTAILNVQVKPAAVGQFFGTLVVQNRSYALTAIAADIPLPTPTLSLGSAAVASGQQRRLTARLPSPAPATATGYLRMTFVPDAAVAGADPAVMFVETGLAQVPFSVTEGSTTVLLAGRDGVTLQTGTTAGRIQLYFSDFAPGFTGDTTWTVAVPAAPVVVDTTAASKTANQLNVVVVAYDNTFSAGQMTFRFFDAAGGQLGSAVTGDFRGQFGNYFKASPGGSTFRMGVGFPVVRGDSVASVEVEFTNSAGTSRTPRIPF